MYKLIAFNAARAIAAIAMGCLIGEALYQAVPAVLDAVAPVTVQRQEPLGIRFSDTRIAPILCRDGLYADLGEGPGPQYYCIRRTYVPLA